MLDPTPNTRAWCTGDDESAPKTTYLLAYLLTHLLAYSTRLLLACGELPTLTLILALTLALTLTLTL